MPGAHGRLAAFDVLRGLAVVSMVLFHLCYDLRFIYGHELAFFRPPLQDLWRASISWTFLLVAGCMCSFSRDGLRRALRYLAVAAVVFVATTVAAVDVPISFGIIFCMGASTLVDHALDRLSLAPRGWWAASVLLVLFLVLREVPQGYVGLRDLGLALPLPRQLYATPYLSFLGLPGPRFSSGDYYPLVPYTLMFLVGASLGRQLSGTGWPAWFARLSCPPLELVGRHALPIYLLHQPLIMAALTLLG